MDDIEYLERFFDDAPQDRAMLTGWLPLEAVAALGLEAGRRGVDADRRLAGLADRARDRLQAGRHGTDGEALRILATLRRDLPVAAPVLDPLAVMDWAGRVMETASRDAPLRALAFETYCAAGPGNDTRSGGALERRFASLLFALRRVGSPLFAEGLALLGQP